MKPTHAPLTLAVVLAFALLAVPASQASSRKPGAVRASATQLRKELTATRAALARASAQLSSLRTLASSQPGLLGDVSAIQRTLRAAQARLKAVGAQTTALRPLLDPPSPLTVAVDQVRHEVAYVQGGVPGYSRGQLISEAALDYVVGHVSDTEFGYLEMSHLKLPAATANSALRAQAGICTESAVTFAAIVHRLGFRVRSVDFNYVDPAPIDTADGHTAVEVFYDGGWHFYDPTYGQFWTDSSGHVLPIAEVRAGEGSLQKDAASFTNVFEDAVFGNDTWFETDPTTGVVIGGTTLP